MRGSRLRVLAGVAIAANVVAIALALTVGRPPTGRNGHWTLWDCSLWLMVAELVVLTGYLACIFYCEHGLPDQTGKYQCFDNCLMWFISATLVVVLLYLVCLLGHFFL